MSMQVDRINQQRIFWSRNYINPNSVEYRTLEDEANYAIDSAMALTSLGSVYVASDINRFFPLNGKVTVNATIFFLENSYTKSVVVKRDIQRKLIEVIQARSNNIGNGNLYADGPLNPIPGVADVNECAEPQLHDCDDNARCINRFGGFDCKCLPGYGDRFSEDSDKSGRYCESCSADYCSGRGTCSIEEDDVKVCKCKGNFYGSQCEIDGEVMAVAVGASVAAVIIIILTLTCLCMWSRKWKREQQKAEILRGFPPAYLAGNPPPPAAMAANYMASMNKAAAYAAAAAAVRHNTLPYGPTGGPPPQLQEELPEARIRFSPSQHENYSQNVYAQLHPPLGNASQFQPGAAGHGFFPEPMYAFPSSPPPTHSPPPPPPQATPRRGTTSSIYGTLPRGPPRPVLREEFDEDGEDALKHQVLGNQILQARGLINYAAFRQNATAAAAAAAQRRAEANAAAARRWSQEDLLMMSCSTPPQSLRSHNSNSHNSYNSHRLDNDAYHIEDALNTTTKQDVTEDDDDDDDDTCSSSSTFDTSSAICHNMKAPSPPPRKGKYALDQSVVTTRPRSASPGKTVTFVESDNDHEVDELEATPRRMKLKPLAALAAFTKYKVKRPAPSPPKTTESDGRGEVEKETQLLSSQEAAANVRDHVALGVKLSATLRSKFGLKGTAEQEAQLQ